MYPQSNQNEPTLQAGPNQRAEEHFRRLMGHLEVPEHLHDGLVMYIVHRVRPGSFLMAVLENDLRQTMARSDVRSGRHLPEIVAFLFQWAPHNCWGSPETVASWLEERDGQS